LTRAQGQTGPVTLIQRFHMLCLDGACVLENGRPRFCRVP
jgi:hypothetical protein